MIKNSLGMSDKRDKSSPARDSSAVREYVDEQRSVRLVFCALHVIYIYVHVLYIASHKGLQTTSCCFVCVGVGKKN